jgi:hypothetical protein
MTERKAKAKWEGTLREGKGIIKFADYQGPYTYPVSKKERVSTRNN